MRRGRANKPVVSERTKWAGAKSGQLADQVFGWGVPQVVTQWAKALRRSPQTGHSKKLRYLGIECKT